MTLKSPEVIRQPTRQLLLVDDDEELRSSMSEALESAGFVVTAAANGREAFARLASAALPDVILLDLLMPVMNGWQFCEERKKVPELATIPIIAMSAAVSKDPRSPYYLDVDDFVVKPVELDELVAKLEGVTRTPEEDGEEDGKEDADRRRSG